MKLTRTATFERGAKPNEERRVALAISSEAPVERWFGVEVLRHDATAIDLGRLADGRHPLLVNHDWDRQAGVIENPVIGADRVLRGEARFSRSALGEELRQDVEDEIRTLVSVGYRIEQMVEIDPATGAAKRTLSGDEFEREMRSQYGDAFERAGPAAARARGEEPPVFHVTRWQPFEVSIVSIPADTSVGVGRAAGAANPAPPLAAAAPAVVPVVDTLPAKDSRIMDKTPDQAPADPLARVNAILDLGRKHDKYVTQAEIDAAIRNPAITVDAFRDQVWQKIESRHTNTSQAAAVGMSAAERQRYSFGRALAAAASGDWSKAGFEREISGAVARAVGQEAEGFYLPPDVFKRDFTAGTAAEAGNLIATDLRADLYVDALRNAMALGQLNVRILAGLTGNVDMPRKSVAGTVAVATAENAALSETQPTTAKVTLAPKRVGAFVEVSKQALIQAAMSLEQMIRDDLLMGSAVLLENQAINGTAASGQARGLRSTAGIGSVVGGTNGLLLDWASVVGLESAAANANAEPDRFSGYLINTKTRGRMKVAQKAANLPFIWDNGATPVNGYRAAVTNNVPSNLTKGTASGICSSVMFGSDWSMLVVGLFGAPDVVVDPYSLATTGLVRITLNQFFDVGVRQPAAFASMEDALTA
jgi:HK97 family phage major capsid protein